MLKPPLFRFFTICCFFMLLSAGKSVAQSGPIVCRILYEYDIEGNRIKREYKCEASWTPADPYPHDETKIFTTLFPNPTSGVITGVFSEPVFSGTFVITAVDGSLVLEHYLTQQATSITFDISHVVPGTYFLTASALDFVETYKIIKIQ